MQVFQNPIRTYVKERGCGDRGTRNAIRSGRLRKPLTRLSYSTRYVRSDLGNDAATPPVRQDAD